PVRRESEREAAPRGQRAAAHARPRSRPQADQARQADQAGASEQRPSPDPAASQAQETPQARASASAPARKGQRQWRWRHRRDPRQLQVAARTPGVSIVNRRNAVIGWGVWKLGKRVAKRKAKSATPTVEGG